MYIVLASPPAAVWTSAGQDERVDVEDDRFVIAPEGSPQRWVLGRPLDPCGDGYVHRVFVEVSDDGSAASGWATLEGQGPRTLRDFLMWLEQGWRGWPGARTWTAMEREMTLEATHDGARHVQIAVTLRRAQRAHDPDAWSARIVLTLEAGEQLRELASAAASSSARNPRDSVSITQNCPIGAAVPAALRNGIQRQIGGSGCLVMGVGVMTERGGHRV